MARKMKFNPATGRVVTEVVPEPLAAKKAARVASVKAAVPMRPVRVVRNGVVMDVETPTVESRFVGNYREPSTDQPGLVMTDDGSVYLIQPDGTRVPLSGGGGGSQTLAQTLALGNDANALQVKNLSDGTDPQDAATVAQRLPTGWTEDAYNPANVETNGGTVTVDDGVNAAYVRPDRVLVSSDSTPEQYGAIIGAGTYSHAPVGVPCFSAGGGAGATVAFDASFLPIKNLDNGVDPQDAATVAQLGGLLPASWIVDPNGNVTFAAAEAVSEPTVIVKGEPSGFAPLVAFQDNEAHNRVYFHLFDAGTPDDEADTYMGLSAGDGGASDAYAVIDLDLVRKGSTDGTYPGYFIEMQSSSDTDGFLGIGTYRSDRNHKAVKVDWASGLVELQRNPDDHTFLIALTVDSKIGFFNAAPVVKPTGVAVTAAGIHAALVSLGLIAA